MSEHKFKAFLVSRQSQWNENQSKNFVDHAVGDPNLPDPTSWEELEAYLKDKPTAIAEAQYIWRLYVVSTHDQAG